jgi:monothiol glutaredoxin
MDVMDRIKQAIESNTVILFMKGTPEFPQCGFSSRTSQALAECGSEFAFINVLAEPEVRENLHRYANWPTFPQLYIGGELIGGCDIVMEMYENGDLKKAIEQAQASK